jgi:8-oxo-dGTP diphosphatase
MVVVGALFRGPQVLLCHRCPNRRWYPNVWDFAGGHVESGESPRAALVRELREELAVEVAMEDVDIEPRRQLVTTGLHLSLWRIDSWVGEPVNAAPEEHDEIRWFEVNEALTLPLAHATYPKLLKELSTRLPPT